MSADADDAIDALLRLNFDGSVNDDGFTNRVMKTLPRPYCPGAWLSPIGLMAGAILCWMTLRSSPTVVAGWHDWLNELPSEPAIFLMFMMTGLSALALIWTISETMEEHRTMLA